jgi:hypothetical protein
MAHALLGAILELVGMVGRNGDHLTAMLTRKVDCFGRAGQLSTRPRAVPKLIFAAWVYENGFSAVGTGHWNLCRDLMPSVYRIATFLRAVARALPSAVRQNFERLAASFTGQCNPLA